MNRRILVGIVAVGLLAGGFWFVANNSNETGHIEAREHDDGAVAEYEIYPSDVVEKIESGEKIVLLDVRTMAEYEEIHIKNSLLLPVQELSQESLTKIGLGEGKKDQEIILYCRSGSRSKTAYDIMKSLGYTNIKSVAGGMTHWEEDNYPFTETGIYDTSSLSGSDEINNVSGPILSVDRKIHDFGIVTQYGGKVETTFALSNVGTETLEIGTLTTSCSCTSASLDKNELEPNESATLTVVFDPNLHEEPLDVFKRTIFIPTNDPNNPEMEIAIQVDIAEGK